MLKIGVVNFSHVRRIGNKPAHILAKQAQNLVNDVIWIEEILAVLSKLLSGMYLYCDVVIIIVSVCFYQKKKKGKI